MDDESDWQRQVLIGLLVLVTVGAVVGGVVALITIKAADLAGIDDSAANTGVHNRPNGGPGSIGGSDTTTSSGPPTSTDTSTEPTEPTQPTGPTDTQSADVGLTLEASPLAVAASQRIDLTGTCTAVPSGTVLQVQRREGGQWTDFPVTATCNGGSYSTYILTGHTGPNRLRMLALGPDDASNTVVVQVG